MRPLIPLIALLSAAIVSTNLPAEPTVKEKIVIDKIWSAVPVGFCLLTEGDMQYVAYYNSERRMVIGMRRLDMPSFTKIVLPSESDKPPRQSKATSTIQGWDSHNYITVAMDDEGHLHLSGNMHVDPLLYFRTTRAGDIRSLEQFKSMVGKNEMRCTYPKFMHGPDGSLIFHYRDGGSGNGNEIYNLYDPTTREWHRLLDTPVLSGEGKMNAYQRGPSLGPDGWYHLAWMWRDTPDAATNHDISYARSKDLIHWENAAGDKLRLPITIDSPGTIIDPVPAGGGMINSAFAFAFDSQNRVVVTYHKHDENGNTQAYAARYDQGAWMVKAVSDWKGKHIFKGRGSAPSTFGTSLSLGAIRQHEPGILALPFNHWKEGSGLLLFEEDTFNRIGMEKSPEKMARFPKALTTVQSDFPGMHVKWASDQGPSTDNATRYVLRWETLGGNRDRPRQGPLPENSELVLYGIEDLEI